ncbi:hypothetical protein E8E11_007581 [Didymella keratinophila]|nr:hypothetical protein E8E11_007581 [Didymella keratinophila]
MAAYTSRHHLSANTDRLVYARTSTWQLLRLHAEIQQLKPLVDARAGFDSHAECRDITNTLTCYTKALAREDEVTALKQALEIQQETHANSVRALEEKIADQEQEISRQADDIDGMSIELGALGNECDLLRHEEVVLQGTNLYLPANVTKLRANVKRLTNEGTQQVEVVKNVQG